MILFSPAKINIGLQIISRRSDGFHDIESLMFPIPFYDLLELGVDFESQEGLSFYNSGILVPGAADSNLCSKAVKLYAEKTGRTFASKVHLHKQIPIGAGLGGGSSNASTLLLGLNQLFNHALTSIQLADLALKLGSDCPLFLHKKPMLARGRGEILEDSMLDLSGYYLVLVNPGINVSTKEAYSLVHPDSQRPGLSEILRADIDKWKGTLENDFEKAVFTRYPQISVLKKKMYDIGSIYTSMSGSGSSVYGFFTAPPDLPDFLKKQKIWEGWI